MEIIKISQNYKFLTFMKHNLTKYALNVSSVFAENKLKGIRGTYDLVEVSSKTEQKTHAVCAKACAMNW